MWWRSLLLVPLLLAACAGAPPEPGPPNLILLSIDTLVPDRLGAYGNPAPTSPTLDRLSRMGHLFTTTLSAAPLTAPSHMTMLTSLPPELHQVRNIPCQNPTSLAPGVTTLAEHLQQEGYRTLACTDGGNVSAHLGFRQGFDSYLDSGAATFLGLVGLRPQEPWFAFLHTYWTHDPYLAPHPYDKLFDPDYPGGMLGTLDDYDEGFTNAGLLMGRERFWASADLQNSRDREHLLHLYDASIRVIDRAVQDLINRLEELGIRDRTVLVITSDHGEEFFQHGRILHERLYQETLRVPLLLVDLRREPTGQLIRGPMQLIDLAPTLLEYLGLPPLPGARGRGQTAALASGQVEPRPVHAKAYHPYRSRTVLSGPWKYIRNPEPRPAQGTSDELGLPRPAVPAEELYRLDRDPGERVNLSLDHPEKLKELREGEARRTRRLEAEAADFAPEHHQVNRETLEKVRALGYVE